jgi:hypothetical protein
MDDYMFPVEIALLREAGLVDQPEEVQLVQPRQVDLQREYPADGDGEVLGVVLEVEDAEEAQYRLADGAPVTDDWNRGDAVLDEGSRLRRRGKTTNQAWACLLQALRAHDGSLLRVADVVVGPPEATLQAWVRDVWGNSAEVLRVHRVTTDADEDDFVLSVRVRGIARVLQVSVRLLARLMTWVMFRPRTLETLYGLRSRLSQQGKALGYTDIRLATVGVDTVSLSFLVSERESSAWADLAGPLGQETVRLSARFKSGLVSEGVVSKAVRVVGSTVTYPLWKTGLYSPSVTLPST